MHVGSRRLPAGRAAGISVNPCLPTVARKLLPASGAIALGSVLAACTFGATELASQLRREFSVVGPAAVEGLSRDL